MLRRVGPLLVITAAAVFAACGTPGPARPAAPSMSAAGGGAQVSIAGETTAPPTTPPAPSLFEFVDYRVTGGNAGVNDDLRVYPDGRAVYESATSTAPKQITVDAGTVAALRTALEQANLPALAPLNGTVTPDVLQHNVIFGGRSVRFVDGAMPPSLGPAVAILDRELAQAKAAG